MKRTNKKPATFTYDVPEARNGRIYRTTSSQINWDEILDDATMPDDIRKYYEPIEESSYDHPGVPAPCWENVKEDEEYPIDRPRGHEWNRDCPCDQCEASKWEDYL